MIKQYEALMGWSEDKARQFCQKHNYDNTTLSEAIANYFQGMLICLSKTVTKCVFGSLY